MEYNNPNVRSSRYPASRYDTRMSQDQMRRVVNRSTTGNRTGNKPRTVKVYVERAKVAIAALAISCIALSSFLTANVINFSDTFGDTKTVNSYVSEYRKEAIGDNTHRTMNNQYYYYDHADVHRDGMDYLQQEGLLSDEGRLNDETAEDLSVYLAYENFGEAQMSKFLDENGYFSDTLEEYAKRKGYESVDAWSEAQKEKLLFLDEAKEKDIELQGMFEEVEDIAKNELQESLGEGYGGK